MAFYDPRPRRQSHESFDGRQPPYPNHSPAPLREPDSHFEHLHAAREPHDPDVAQGSRDARRAVGVASGGAVHDPHPAGIVMPNPQDFVPPAVRSSPPQPADTLHEHAAQEVESGDDYAQRLNPYYGGTMDGGFTAHADGHARHHSPSGSYRAHVDDRPEARRSSNGSGRRSSRAGSRSSTSSSRRHRSSHRRGKDKDNRRVTEGRAPTWGDSIYSLFGYLRRKI